MDVILIAAGAAFVSFVIVAFAVVRRDPPEPGPDPRLEPKDPSQDARRSTKG